MNNDPTRMWVAQVELARSLEPVGVCRPQARDDVAARVLVRMHGQPLGFVTLTSNGNKVLPLASAIGTQLHEPLASHLEADGLAHVEPNDRGIAGWDRCSQIADRDHTEPIGVVVCTRNNATGLAECLRRLQKLNYGFFGVVVVDNAPSDSATRDCFVREVGGDARFRYVREDAPGLSRARNRGLAETGAKFVAFTDDDVQVDPWWLDGIASGFARDPLAGCVTGLVPPAELENPAQLYFDRRYSWASHMQARIFDLDKRRDDSALYPYSPGVFGTGANFAFDRELIVSLGGFDIALGAGTPSGGGEDLDAFVRVLQAGRSIVYEPAAIVWHVHRCTPRALRRQLFFYGAGLTAFITKHLVDPRTSLQVLSRLPKGLRRATRIWGAEEIEGRAPAMLVAAEAVGMVAGPLAYARGRLRSKRRVSLRDDLLLPPSLVLLAYARVRRLFRRSSLHPAPLPRTTSTIDVPANYLSTVATREEISVSAVRRFHVCDVLLPAAGLLWVLSAGRVDPAAMNDWGLLRALPVTYFVALALLALSSAWLLASKNVRPVRLSLHLVALVLILHGTVPLIFQMPNYPWAYKHMGVVDYILVHGSVDTTIDIYHSWPGFFALAAWFEKLAGVGSAISYAAWAPVYFNLLICLGLSFVFRALPVSRRTRWLALFCLVPANWVGQDYFAPQAIAVVLAFGVFGMALTWLRTERPIRLATFLRRLAGRMALGPKSSAPNHPHVVVPNDLRAARLCAILGVFTFLVVTHQLTPYVVIVGLGLVSAAGLVRPRWVVAVMTAITGAYLMLRLPFVTETQNLLGSFFDLFGDLGGNELSVAAQPGRRLTALGAQVLIFGLWMLAGIGILRRLRAGRPVFVIALLAASPAFIRITQSYGGEAGLRVYLFSLPWTILLAAFALDMKGRARDLLRGVAIFGLLAVTSTLFMSAFFGSEELYRVRPGEVDASRYFYEHAEPGSVLVLAAPPFPGRLSAEYASFINSDWQPSLMGQAPAFRARLLGPHAVNVLSRLADAYATGHGSEYFVITDTQKVYAEVLGLAPNGSLARLESAVAASPGWQLVCRNTDATLFIHASTAPAGRVGACRDATPPYRPPLPSGGDVAGLAVALPFVALALVRRSRKESATQWPDLVAYFPSFKRVAYGFAAFLLVAGATGVGSSILIHSGEARKGSVEARTPLANDSPSELTAPREVEVAATAVVPARPVARAPDARVASSEQRNTGYSIFVAPQGEGIPEGKRSGESGHKPDDCGLHDEGFPFCDGRSSRPTR